MAKLIGPLMSLDARGQLGKNLIFSKSGKSNYAKTYKTPTNPQSAAQTAHRLGIGFISQLWRTLHPEQKATWQELADRLQLPLYHAFLKYNCAAWVRDEPVTCSAPTQATGQQLPIEGTFYPQATGAYPFLSCEILIERSPWHTKYPLHVQIADCFCTGSPPYDLEPTRLSTVAIVRPDWTHDEWESTGLFTLETPTPASGWLSCRLWTENGEHTPWRQIYGSNPE